MCTAKRSVCVPCKTHSQVELACTYAGGIRSYEHLAANVASWHETDASSVQTAGCLTLPEQRRGQEPRVTPHLRPARPSSFEVHIGHVQYVSTKA